MGNNYLHKAKKAANDEFYTTMKTINKELIHYEKYFNGKTVYLNCDDPRESNFFKYFTDNFHRLGLKRLIASCYKKRDDSLLGIDSTSQKAVWVDYYGDLVNGAVPSTEQIGVQYFKGDGDFRGEESVFLLKQADIVVTNPPFTLFREFIAQLIEYNKKFLVLGGLTAVGYKEIFPLLKDNKMWLGVHYGTTSYEIPRDPGNKVVYWENGKLLTEFRNIVWWTNLSNRKRVAKIALKKKYVGNEAYFPKYDNYNAINVDKVADIPVDYDGVVGVPLTFMDKYNPEQFEIVGFRKGDDGKDLTFGGTAPYTRILIRKRYSKSEEIKNRVGEIGNGK